MTATGKRTILHCDCNNFFASVELLERPDLEGRPVAIAGDQEQRHGIILAKNQLAKRYGVQTAEPIWQARQKCPGLILLPPHHEKYSDMSRRVNAIYLEYTDQVEPFSVDESFLDVTASRTLFGDGVTSADTLRRRIREELGITISVGVSDNKTWAKMGSDYKKPDATTLITRENVHQLLYPLDVKELMFVGASAAATLHRHGVNTIGALAGCEEQLLVRYLGQQGGSLWRMARGLDDSPVRRWGESDPVKSVGNGMTFPHDLTGREACHDALMPLCDSVAGRLRAQRLKCRTITLQIKDVKLKVVSRQKTLAAPTSLTRQIHHEACALYDALWSPDIPLRLMTVTAGNLCSEDDAFAAQTSFLTETAPDDPRLAALDKAVDQVRSRFGKRAVRPGTPVIK